MKSWISAAMFLICVIAGSTFPGRTTIDPSPGLPAAGDSLLDLVPATALAAVEIYGLERRWSEIRSIDAISGLQDVVLSEVGIAPDGVPVLCGERALFMLLSSGDAPYVIPVLLLQPRDRREALRVLEGSKGVHYCDGRGALWVGPLSVAESLERIARNPDPGLSSVLPIEEIDSRLPGGGLARGYIQPRAWVELLNRLADRTNFELPRWVASWVEAELSAVRYIAFRREISGGEIETEALAAYDLHLLPAEVARIFAPGPPRVAEAPFLPAGTIAAVAFRPEAAAWLPWLRYLAARDRHGPMRNLGFQMDEFEKRYRRNLQRDLCDAIAERGWLFLLEGERPGFAAAVALIETHPAPALERTLADLLDWAGEQVWVESLGALFPHCWSRMENGVTTRGMDLWTPLGRRTCLAFTVNGRYLALASSEQALRAGLGIAPTLPGPEVPSAADPQASIRVRGAGIARMFDAWLALAGRPDDRLANAVARLLADFEGARGDVRYEPDAVRFEGRARFSGTP